VAFVNVARSGNERLINLDHVARIDRTVTHRHPTTGEWLVQLDVYASVNDEDGMILVVSKEGWERIKTALGVEARDLLEDQT
jgi:transcriptional regulator of NAD metabolism